MQIIEQRYVLKDSDGPWDPQNGSSTGPFLQGWLWWDHIAKALRPVPPTLGKINEDDGTDDRSRPELPSRTFRSWRPSWDHYGSVRSPLGGLLGTSRGPSGPCWSHILEASDQKGEGSQQRPSLWSPKSRLLGLGALLGRGWDSWGLLGAFMLPSWGYLGLS